MSKKSFGLIVNYNAGKVVSGLYKRKEYEKIFGSDGLIRETKDLNDVVTALKEFQEAGVDILFSYGGDGTHQKVLSLVFTLGLSFPYIAPLKGGTMNMLVKDIGLGKGSLKVTSAIVSLYRENKNLHTFEKPIIKITYQDNEPLYGFYLANGAIYNVIKRYYENPSSVSNAVKITLEGLFDTIISKESNSRFFKRITCKVLADGYHLPHEQFIGTMLGTLNRVVFGMTPFIEKAKNKEEFHFIGYSFPIKKMIFYFPFLAWGNRVKSKEIYPLSCKKMVMTCNTGFVLDGEPYLISEPTDLHIEVGGYLNIPIIS